MTMLSKRKNKKLSGRKLENHKNISEIIKNKIMGE